MPERARGASGLLLLRRSLCPHSSAKPPACLRRPNAPRALSWRRLGAGDWGTWVGPGDTGPGGWARGIGAAALIAFVPSCAVSRTAADPRSFPGQIRPAPQPRSRGAQDRPAPALFAPRDLRQARAGAGRRGALRTSPLLRWSLASLQPPGPRDQPRRFGRSRVIARRSGAVSRHEVLLRKAATSARVPSRCCVSAVSSWRSRSSRAAACSACRR